MMLTEERVHTLFIVESARGGINKSTVRIRSISNMKIMINGMKFHFNLRTFHDMIIDGEKGV